MNGEVTIKVGGMIQPVKLPFNGKDGINNPLFDNQIAKYLMKTWAGNVTEWTASVIILACVVTGTSIDDTNQYSEGVV